jgi:hypothetical protein
MNIDTFYLSAMRSEPRSTTRAGTRAAAAALQTLPRFGSGTAGTDGLLGRYVGSHGVSHFGVDCDESRVGEQSEHRGVG